MTINLNSIYIKYFVFLLVVFLIGCGSNSDGGSPNIDRPIKISGAGDSTGLNEQVSEQSAAAETNTKDNINNVNRFLSGKFIDAPVNGLSYTGGGITGITGTEGEFSYLPGSKVSFFIGDIALGSAPGAQEITPLELVPGATDTQNAVVINITRLLQTLDNDANPSNGIVINENVQAQAKGMQLDFTLAPNDFGDDGSVQIAVSELTSLTRAGGRQLVTIQTAQTHFREHRLALLAGAYTGNFSGDKTGIWNLTVALNGTVTGEILPNRDLSSQTLSGNVNDSGIMHFASANLNFEGTLSLSGSLEGTWAEPGSANIGTYNGHHGTNSDVNGNNSGEPGKAVNQGFGVLMLSGADTPLIGTSFSPESSFQTTLSNSEANTWSFRANTLMINVDTADKLIGEIEFQLFNSNDARYHKICPCENVVINKTGNSATFSNVILSPHLLSPKQASNNIMLNGVLNLSRNSN